MPETTEQRLLLVDDDQILRHTLSVILQQGGFEVHTAANVSEALTLIGSEKFDVLVSDLHMPHDGDGLTVVSAMRHTNPGAVTIIFSAHPEMKRAAAAILAQTDDIVVKTGQTGNLVAMIWDRVRRGAAPAPAKSTIATILEEGTAATISDWLARVGDEPDVLSIVLSEEARAQHLPQLFRDLIFRLRNPLDLGSHALVSEAAVEHGLLRRRQGYSAAMIVEESRMLQVSIFQTLQNNLHRVNFSLLLVGVMSIADEVDSQLAQTMTGYVREFNVDARPLSA